MSRTYSKLTNEYQKHSKVDFQDYLYSANEPAEHVSNGFSEKRDVEQLENSESIRQGIRDFAHRIRNRYA